jgi:hypothetical protein
MQLADLVSSSSASLRGRPNESLHFIRKPWNRRLFKIIVWVLMDALDNF